MSFSVTQIAALKVGDIIWEGSQYGSIQFEVISAPVVTEIDEGERKIEFTGKSLNEKTSREIQYMLNSKYMHYGPKLYRENPYITAAELDAMYPERTICKKPPTGWSCSRKAGHEGPCAASEVNPVGMQSSSANHSNSCNRQSGGSFCDCGFS